MTKYYQTADVHHFVHFSHWLTVFVIWISHSHNTATISKS